MQANYSHRMAFIVTVSQSRECKQLIEEVFIIFGFNCYVVLHLMSSIQHVCIFVCVRVCVYRHFFANLTKQFGVSKVKHQARNVFDGKSIGGADTCNDCVYRKCVCMFIVCGKV